MITQTLSLFGALYDAIGPGFILAAALPFFLIASALLVWVGFRRGRASD